MHRCNRTQVAVASGDVVEAFRSRDGELSLGQEPESDWVLSVRRLGGISGSFVWDASGPRITYTSDSDSGDVTIDCHEKNGLSDYRT